MLAYRSMGLALAIIVSVSGFAQDTSKFTYPVSLEGFVKQFINHHPQVKINELITATAEASRMGLSGVFDPVLKASFGEKQFQDKLYYRYAKAAVEVPVPIGEVTVGYDNSGGEYLNPEATLPDDGLLKIGYTLPLLKGLWTDERRTALKKREATVQMAEAERQVMLNDLVGEAIRTYLEWHYYYRVLSLYNDILSNASLRHQQVKTSFESGDLPAIDTVESFTRVQVWREAALEAKLGFFKKTQELNLYLWTETGEPAIMDQGAYPTTNRLTTVLPNIRDTVAKRMKEEQFSHPKVEQLEWGLAMLRADEQYAKELLKPKLDVDYNWLLGQPSETYTALPLSENYIFGVSFSFPLFLRQERSKLALTRLKLQEGEYKKDYLRWEILTKLRTGLYELDNLEERFHLKAVQANSFNQLYEGEMEKWYGGFSTQFVLNMREQQFLKAMLEKERLYLAKLVAELHLGVTLAVFE